ncbi:MAG: RNA polymerase sigma factor [Spirochaetaceae bacterium]|jgi:RNA polymerase sigma-70 factor (ECF subfamily)|nr:RNA polymerase sigma factor [Spirochaetaceae bacterium]
MPDADFRKLYDTVFPILYRIALRIAGGAQAAEDLCQDAFLKICEKNMVFPSLDDAKFWLIRVVKNAALNYAKRKERERVVYQKAFYNESRVTRTGEEELVRKETAQEVNEALDALPKDMKVILVLTENGGLNYKEIGRILGISEDNVKIRVFRARKKLQSILEKQDGGIPCVRTNS